MIERQAEQGGRGMEGAIGCAVKHFRDVFEDGSPGKRIVYLVTPSSTGRALECGAAGHTR